MTEKLITDAMVNSACMSYRHDFGLLPELDREAMRRTARWWLEAWEKEGFSFAPDPAVNVGAVKARKVAPVEVYKILKRNHEGGMLDGDHLSSLSRQIAALSTPPQSGKAGGAETPAEQPPSPQPKPNHETRRTFTVPDGHYAVRSEDGRATGEVRPLPATQPNVVPPILLNSEKDGGGE